MNSPDRLTTSSLAKCVFFVSPKVATTFERCSPCFRCKFRVFQRLEAAARETPWIQLPITFAHSNTATWRAAVHSPSVKLAPIARKRRAPHRHLQLRLLRLLLTSCLLVLHLHSILVLHFLQSGRFLILHLCTLLQVSQACRKGFGDSLSLSIESWTCSVETTPQVLRAHSVVQILLDHRCISSISNVLLKNEFAA